MNVANTNSMEDCLVLKCLDIIEENMYWMIPLIFSLIFALFSIFSAIKQNKTQETQISIALMEKRMSYFQICKDAIGIVLRDVHADGYLLQNFRVNTFGVEFYFKEDVVEFCDRLEGLIQDMWRVSNKIDAVIIDRKEDDHHSENVDKQDALLTSFIEASKEIKAVFAPYLDFSKYKIR